MLAGMIARPRATSSRTNSGRQPFADRDELHLGRDLALARVVELRDARTARGCAARRDPRLAQLRQPVVDVVPLRAAGVVDAKRRLAARQRDLAHRHAHALRSVDVDFL